MPQMLFLAAIVMAGALVMQQRLAIASHRAANPARQIAYQMRVFHQASITYKAQNPAASGLMAAPPPALTAQFRFISCADAKSVATYFGGNPLFPEWMNGANTTDDVGIMDELLVQAVSPPELGGPGEVPGVSGYAGQNSPQLVPVTGVGLSTGAQIQTGQGLVALPSGCSAPIGVPVIQTQVFP